MSRLTEYHCGVAVIKDKSKLSEAMAKLAQYEGLEEQGLLASVVHGEWETVPNKVVEHGEIERMGTAERCSNCRHASSEFKKHMSFCPNCGADMRKKVGADD